MLPDPAELTLRPLRAPRRLTLAEQVTRDLTARMEGGELRPGDQLPTERELMARYGVSRTVIREAMSSLRAAGRLATQQGRGAFVLEPAPQLSAYRLDPSEAGAAADVLKLMEIRIALESEAASLAAQRRDEAGLAELTRIVSEFEASIEDPEQSAVHDQAFHLCVARLSGNAYFGSLLGGLSSRLLPRARIDLFKEDAAAKLAYLRLLQVEHANILDAIRRADAEGARAAMRLHLTNSRERLRAALDRLGGAAP
ncbi:FadR/GntR family transcriptional regulator [Roseomonas marmotae]|uniref:FadR family transcriptional regulator n=1 Tax=Roseomonas marmotae TaxID=2768161 RepID=A0ABS3K6P4_9PROT|nr:FadR/GntR family transcriptional regulator [Roseomonas marmotae]MBO1073110.1 FadR family transcriptional regulator [Roseomonas marmotae]QTI79252.1 FadR family transcriptional regulator [Roseomonas marmotae]